MTMQKTIKMVYLIVMLAIMLTSCMVQAAPFYDDDLDIRDLLLAQLLKKQDGN